jgi:hypothetical protein
MAGFHPVDAGSTPVPRTNASREDTNMPEVHKKMSKSSTPALTVKWQVMLVKWFLRKALTRPVLTHKLVFCGQKTTLWEVVEELNLGLYLGLRPHSQKAVNDDLPVWFDKLPANMQGKV